eukprot:m.135063 g.135063  ORF g.135063 m.135063 type:complete len:53 (+) comp15985_c0_seq28:2169-2327(+)
MMVDETVASQLPDDMAVAYTFDAYNEVTATALGVDNPRNVCTAVVDPEWYYG